MYPSSSVGFGPKTMAMELPLGRFLVLGLEEAAGGQNFAPHRPLGDGDG